MGLSRQLHPRVGPAGPRGSAGKAGAEKEISGATVRIEAAVKNEEVIYCGRWGGSRGAPGSKKEGASSVEADAGAERARREGEQAEDGEHSGTSAEAGSLLPFLI